MSVKKNYLVGIMDDRRISDVNAIIAKYASLTFEYSSFMFFSKQPIDTEHVTNDITLFQLEADNEGALKKTLNEVIDELNTLNADYVLADDDTKEMIVTIDFVGKIFIKFDNVSAVPVGAFDKINGLKSLTTDFGYCKGFKPQFRPVEGRSIEGVDVNSEIVYLFSDSAENLEKLRQYITRQVLEIEPNFIVEFKVFNF